MKLAVAVAVLPAASVSLAVTVCGPSARVGVKDQAPELSAVVVPSAAPFSARATVLPASAVPARVGSEVTPSVADAPGAWARAAVTVSVCTRLM